MTAAFASAGAGGALPAAADPIRATIAALEARLDAMPKVIVRGTGFEAWDRARDLLAADIPALYGGRVTIRPEIARVTLHGITASSTTGVVGALRNWIAAARKRSGATS